MRYFLFLFLFVGSLFGKQMATIKVEAMHCPLCTVAVKKAIKTVPGIFDVNVTLNTKIAQVTFDDFTTIDSILDAIATTTYKGEVVEIKEIED